jgi:hypothetical protein
MGIQLLFLSSTLILQQFLKLFLAIVIVSMMALMSIVTVLLKQNLIDGLSKKSSFCLNFFDGLIFLFVLQVFVFLMSLILGLPLFLYRAICSLF